jgi:hypothetical protein
MKSRYRFAEENVASIKTDVAVITRVAHLPDNTCCGENHSEKIAGDVRIKVNCHVCTRYCRNK